MSGLHSRSPGDNDSLPWVPSLPEDCQGIIVGSPLERFAIDGKDLIALLNCAFLGSQAIWKHSVDLKKPKESEPTHHLNQIPICADRGTPSQRNQSPHTIQIRSPCVLTEDKPGIHPNPEEVRAKTDCMSGQTNRPGPASSRGRNHQRG